MHPLRTAVAELIWSPGDERGEAIVCHDDNDGDLPAGDEEGAAGAGADGSRGWGGGGGSSHAAVMEARHYYVLTYGLLVAATLAAISVPSELPVAPSLRDP